MVRAVLALGRVLASFVVCVCLLQRGSQARHVRHGHSHAVGMLEPSNDLQPDGPGAPVTTTGAVPQATELQTTEGAAAAVAVSTESIVTDGAAAEPTVQPAVTASTPAAADGHPPPTSAEGAPAVAPGSSGQPQRFRHVREDVVPHSGANASAAPALNPPDATTEAPQPASAVTPSSESAADAASTATTQASVANKTDATAATTRAPVDRAAALPATGLGSKFLAAESLVSESSPTSNSTAKHSNSSLALPGSAVTPNADASSAVARTTSTPAAPAVTTSSQSSVAGNGDPSSEVETPALNGSDVVSANGTAADEAKFKRIFTKTVPSDGEGNAAAQNSASLLLRTTPKPHAGVVATEQVDVPNNASLSRRNQSHHNAKFAQANAKLDTTTSSPGFNVIPTLVERPETIKTWPQASMVPAGAVAAAQHFLKVATGDNAPTPEKVFGINSQKDDLVEVASPNTLSVDSESQL